jgi:hypothetical protein
MNTRLVHASPLRLPVVRQESLARRKPCDAHIGVTVTALPFLVRKDAALVHRDESLIGDAEPVGVATEVSDHLLLGGREHLAAKERAHHAHREEELPASAEIHRAPSALAAHPELYIEDPDALPMPAVRPVVPG